VAANVSYYPAELRGANVGTERKPQTWVLSENNDGQAKIVDFGYCARLWLGRWESGAGLQDGMAYKSRLVPARGLEPPLPCEN
jgi:hypothetical protein